MMRSDLRKDLSFYMMIGIFFLLLFPTISFSQNWTPLPPYNTLWPLWSSMLSPVNPATGLPTPIVTSLTPSAVLPLQPALTWDPGRPNPWLLYNSPLGLIYYDAAFGFNAWPPWPPLGIIPPITGFPFTIALPVDYGSLPPTDPVWLLNTIPVANNLYNSIYPLYSYIAAFPFAFGSPPPPVPLLTLTTPVALPIPGATAIAVPPVLSATAILGL